MTATNPLCTRRTIIGLISVAAWAIGSLAHAAANPSIKVFKDPNCGCCNGWVEHLRSNGFAVDVTETRNLRAVRARLGVPSELASCHTAEMGNYVLEGHVPATAIVRLLAERPDARGLTVPGMPIGSPGMEGGTPEPYDVILFSKDLRQVFGRYLGDQAL